MTGESWTAEHCKKDGRDGKNKREGYKDKVVTFGTVIGPTGINRRKKRGCPIAHPHDPAESSVLLTAKKISDQGPIQRRSPIGDGETNGKKVKDGISAAEDHPHHGQNRR